MEFHLIYFKCISCSVADALVSYFQFLAIRASMSMFINMFGAPVCACVSISRIVGF